MGHRRIESTKTVWYVRAVLRRRWGTLMAAARRVPARVALGYALLAVLGVGASVVVTGCSFTNFGLNYFTETDASKFDQATRVDYWISTDFSGQPVEDQGHSIPRTWEKGKLDSGQVALLVHVQIGDPSGWVAVSEKVGSARGGAHTQAVLKILKSLASGRLVGKPSVAYHAHTDSLSLHGLGVLRAKSNSACLSMSGASLPHGGRDQFVGGKFTVLGGTGQGARLRATGKFLAIQPSGLPSEQGYQKPFKATFLLYVSKTSLGAAPRGLSSKCRAAGTLPTKPKITFKGFAFGPKSAQTGSLPSGTKVYPSGSTVSGAVGCGSDNNLYALLTYSGPAGAKAGFSYVGPLGPGKGFDQQAVKKGSNNLFVGTAPGNGFFQVSGGVNTPNSSTPIDFSGSVTLARTC